MSQTFCKKDFVPHDHSLDLMYAFVSGQEFAAGTTKRMTEDEIRRMCAAETANMRLYFISKRIARSSWDLTWLKWMKRHYENYRHRRTDSGSGFKPMNEAYGQLMPEKPITKPERRYRIPTDEESIGKFKQLEAEMLKL